MTTTTNMQNQETNLMSGVVSNPINIMNTPLTLSNIKWLSINCTYTKLRSFGYSIRFIILINNITYPHDLPANKPQWFQHLLYLITYCPDIDFDVWPLNKPEDIQNAFKKMQIAFNKDIIARSTNNLIKYYVPSETMIVTTNNEHFTPTPPENDYLSNQEQNILKHDLDIRYRDCYGLYNGKIIIAVDFDTNPVRVIFKELLANKTFTPSQSAKWGPAFDFTLPKMGMLNYKNYTILAERVHKKSSPARYRKAIRPDVVLFSDISYRENMILNNSTPNFLNLYSSSTFIEMASTLFNPKFYTYQEALDSVLNYERLAAAFSSSMAIAIDFAKNRIVLYKYGWIIAQLNLKTKKWKMLVDTFNQDLINNNIPMEAN